MAAPSLMLRAVALALRVGLAFAAAHALLLGERKVHGNGGNNCHRFAVQQGRLVFPLLHRIDRCLDQQWVASDNFQIVDRSFFADFSFENNDALNTGLLRERRINRLNLREQICGLNVSTNAYALRRRRRWWGRWWWW